MEKELEKEKAEMEKKIKEKEIQAEKEAKVYIKKFEASAMKVITYVIYGLAVLINLIVPAFMPIKYLLTESMKKIYYYIRVKKVNPLKIFIIFWIDMCF